MISRYEAWLNGVSLGSVSPQILVLDIQYKDYSIQDTTLQVAKRQGMRLDNRYIPETSVAISFAIREYDTRKRQKICADIIAWAKNGGNLKTSDRDGQRLRCVLKKPPAVSSVMKWLDPLQLELCAYALPFWEEEAEAQLTLSGESGNGTLYVPGNVDGAMIEATVQAVGALSSCNLSANGRTMNLSGLNISAGQSIVLSYNDDMIQSIKCGNTSLLSKRTGADDLLAKCGEQNAFAFTASGNATVTFSVRGLWM